MKSKRMLFFAKPDDSNDADKIAADIAAAAASVAAKETPTKQDDEELDAKAEFFIRKVTDSVRTAIAELLNPSAPAPVLEADEEEEVVESGKKVRRKRKTSAPTPVVKKRSLLERLF
jgi:hypothetical protein